MQSLKDICYLCLPKKHQKTFWNVIENRTSKTRQDAIMANETTSDKTLAKLLVKGKVICK